MKFWKYMIVGALAMAFGAGSVMAGGVSGTPHDFTAVGWNGTGEMCLPCHIPHNADANGGTDQGFLWNHTVPSDGDFTMPDTNAVLGAESLVCLGCHDGQTAMDSFGHNTTNTATLMTGGANVGTDLTDDHPVGVEYGGGTRLAAVGTIWGTHPGIQVGFSGLPLYGEAADDTATIECATCHTPHSNDHGNFLRLSNAGSGLCIACHINHYDGSTS